MKTNESQRLGEAEKRGKKSVKNEIEMDVRDRGTQRRKKGGASTHFLVPCHLLLFTVSFPWLLHCLGLSFPLALSILFHRFALCSVECDVVSVSGAV